MHAHARHNYAGHNYAGGGEMAVPLRRSCAHECPLTRTAAPMPLSAAVPLPRHNYAGHNYADLNYVGHNYAGDDHVSKPTGARIDLDADMPMNVWIDICSGVCICV